MKVAVVVPAHNEEDSLPLLLPELVEIKQQFKDEIEIVVVNDGSSDDTARVAAGYECVVLSIPYNLGIGGAVQLGFRYARDRHFDVAVQVDGDGQHAPKDILKLLAAVVASKADIVIGSRFLEGSGFRSTATRRVGIRFFNRLIKSLTQTTITDSTSGFRLLGKRALDIACEYYPDEYPEPESLVAFSLQRLKIVEIPVEMRERQGGRSSIRTFSSIYYMAKVTLAILFTYLRFRWKEQSDGEHSPF